MLPKAWIAILVLPGHIDNHGQANFNPFRLANQQQPCSAYQQHRERELHDLGLEQAEKCAQRHRERPRQKNTKQAVFHVVCGNNAEPSEHKQIRTHRRDDEADNRIQRHKPHRGNKQARSQKRDNHDGRKHPFKERSQTSRARKRPNERRNACQQADKYANPVLVIRGLNWRGKPTALPKNQRGKGHGYSQAQRQAHDLFRVNKLRQNDPIFRRDKSSMAQNRSIGLAAWAAPIPLQLQSH